MITENALAVYKNKPALIREKAADKITIRLQDGGQIKVREKDITLLHSGPVTNFDWLEMEGSAEIAVAEIAIAETAVREAWELLSADCAQTPVSLKELAELVYGGFTPASAWFTFNLLMDGLYFTGTISDVRPRPREQVAEDAQKRGEKQRSSEERELFLERLRKRRPYLSPEGVSLGETDDRRFMQDIEALALGKSAKSRTMKDIGLGETPEDAHALLLESGFWNGQINPHPGRAGISLLPASYIPDPPPPEDRRDLTGLAAFAIDSPWSHDPDDAVSFAAENGTEILYVHVADPASSLQADSPAEKEARDRGATLYIPEGSFRMLAEAALPLFILGNTGPALTFKMTLNPDGAIESTEIFPSTVNVSRLTYQEADAIIAHDVHHDSYLALRAINALAERNFSRRIASGAIGINLPETHISLTLGKVTVEPVVPYRSADMVRECMLLAGEGAGIWAIQHNVPFPYVQQEIESLPNTVLPGMAGSYQLRRCMRPRLLSVKPGLHGGLGMNTYSQVTSPLRRYTDLIAHIQIRAFLRNARLLTADELSARMMAGEAAAIAVTQAERASRAHWLTVYLADKKESVWDAVVLEKKGSRWAVMIPALALETQAALRKEVTPNQTIKLILKSVHIPKCEAVFVEQL